MRMILGPIVKELEEPEGPAFVVYNLKPPTTEEPRANQFQAGIPVACATAGFVQPL
jgi:hypothetical protein